MTRQRETSGQGLSRIRRWLATAGAGNITWRFCSVVTCHSS
jgi:hypothetical protein